MSKKNHQKPKPRIRKATGLKGSPVTLDKKLFRNIKISERVDRLEKYAQELEGGFKRATSRMLMNMAFSLNALVEVLITENVILRGRLESVRQTMIKEEHEKEQAKLAAQVETEKARLEAEKQATEAAASAPAQAGDTQLAETPPEPCAVSEGPPVQLDTDDKPYQAVVSADSV